MERGRFFRALVLPLAMLIAPLALPGAAVAAPNASGGTAAEVALEETARVTEAPASVAVEASVTDPAPGADAYVPMAPTPGKGMPVDGGMGFQEQYSPIGEYGLWMHNAILLPLIVMICLLVLGLLLWVVARYRRGANPVPSRTSHNTLIEVIWTGLPVLILIAIAIPSIDLLAKQYKTAPADALTIKVTGYQWYWGYTYPDNGGFEVISNMLPEDEAIARGEPAQLAADNRIVVPAGEPIRLQVTGADVIHSFAIPSLWYKLDAVPGRINEKMLIVEEPGVYYGQCMELCGPRHAFMPIALEALPRPQFEAWVRSQGGTVAGDSPPADAGVPEPAGLQQPESAVPGAPGAGPAPEGAAGTPAPSNGSAASAPAA